ncbi:MAG: nucleotidyltransferase family protein [bacterium]|nr:nucleotidyltransferase family protein [bacterium]
MKAILLCGGVGSRLRPLTDRMPKPLVPIAGRPLLDYQLTHLAAHGFTDVYMNLYFLPEKIKAFVGDGSRWGVTPHFQVESTPRGTAGALRLFAEELDEPFLVLYSDVINEINLSQLFEAHKLYRPFATVVVRRTDHPEDSDLVTIDRHERIRALYLKPHKTLPQETLYGNVGVFVFDPEILHHIPKNLPADIFQNIFPKLVLTHALRAFVSDAFIQDVGTIERLQKVEERMQK